VGDRIGGRRLYTFGLGLFTAASAACALAPSATALIGFRVLQGVGAAIVVPPGLTLLTSAFPAQRHGGRRLGRDRRPGGRCRAADRRRRHPGATWHWIFWVNVPISLAAAIGTRLVLPESLARSGRHHGGPALRRVRSGLREVG
jgi:MFS family permease